MTRTLGKFAPSLAFAALAVMVALSGAQSAATHGNSPLSSQQSAAERLFPDAPDGVDPMVTGPVSASFRQQQAGAGCARAKWPEIPAACYPR